MFVPLFMAVLGLCCCARVFSRYGEWGLLLVAVWALEHVGFCACDTWVQLPHSVCCLPRPGIQLSSPALAGGFLTTGPQGNPEGGFFKISFISLLVTSVLSICFRKASWSLVIIDALKSLVILSSGSSQSRCLFPPENWSHFPVFLC